MCIFSPDPIGRHADSDFHTCMWKLQYNPENQMRSRTFWFLYHSRPIIFTSAFFTFHVSVICFNHFRKDSVRSVISKSSRKLSQSELFIRKAFWKLHHVLGQTEKSHLESVKNSCAKWKYPSLSLSHTHTERERVLAPHSLFF